MVFEGRGDRGEGLVLELVFLLKLVLVVLTQDRGIQQWNKKWNILTVWLFTKILRIFSYFSQFKGIGVLNDKNETNIC